DLLDVPARVDRGGHGDDLLGDLDGDRGGRRVAAPVRDAEGEQGVGARLGRVRGDGHVGARGARADDDETGGQGGGADGAQGLSHGGAFRGEGGRGSGRGHDGV